MVDVNPQSTMSRYTPRPSDLVDAVAETRRIADQQMRANPLTNARTDNGLTRWMGNYGDALVWIGDITPYDLNLVNDYGAQKYQRGFVLRRDDPGLAFALTLYDSSPTAGLPLKQTLTISDGTGTRMLQEAFNQQGRRFPDKAIPMYPRIAIDSGGNATVAELVWAGEANLIGTHVHFVAQWSTSGATLSQYLVFSGGGVTITTPTTSSPPNTRVDITSIWQASDYVTVEWYVWRSGGAGLYYPRPRVCRNYTDG